jgi:hypothetical protein
MQPEKSAVVHGCTGLCAHGESTPSSLASSITILHSPGRFIAACDGPTGLRLRCEAGRSRIADRRVQVKRLSQFFKTAAYPLGTICLPISAFLFVR